MIDVVEGHGNTPFVSGAMVAEGASLVTNLGSAGVGYINGDLTVALARLPVDESPIPRRRSTSPTTLSHLRSR